MMLGNVDIFKSLKSYLSLLLYNVAKKFDQSASDILVKRFLRIGKDRYSECGKQ